MSAAENWFCDRRKKKERKDAGMEERSAAIGTQQQSFFLAFFWGVVAESVTDVPSPGLGSSAAASICRSYEGKAKGKKL